MTTEPWMILENKFPQPQWWMLIAPPGEEGLVSKRQELTAARADLWGQFACMFAEREIVQPRGGSSGNRNPAER
jgi:hypothetical protein